MHKSAMHNAYDYEICNTVPQSLLFESYLDIAKLLFSWGGSGGSPVRRSSKIRIFTKLHSMNNDRFTEELKSRITQIQPAEHRGYPQKWKTVYIWWTKLYHEQKQLSMKVETSLNTKLPDWTSGGVTKLCSASFKSPKNDSYLCITD